jgi:hypothetical protein
VVEFEETGKRHHCRNPKCRGKLPDTTTNYREAFCCRGCYRHFYEKRCRVCENPIEQRAGAGGKRVVCGRRKCRNAMRYGVTPPIGRFYALRPSIHAATNVVQEVPVNGSLLSASKTPRWTVIAGPRLTPREFRCSALDPDIPGVRSAMEDIRRSEAQYRGRLDGKIQTGPDVEANGVFTATKWREVVSSDGVRCFVKDA